MGSSFSGTNSHSSSYRDNRNTTVKLYDDSVGREARDHHSSDFCDPQSLVGHLQPGDLVQQKGNLVHQWFYSHFALYIGNGDVIHVWRVPSGGYSILRGDLVDVFRGELVRKNNVHDDVIPPRPSRQIVLDARKWLGVKWEYNLITNNCEHFVTLCRYGRKISLQALGIGDVVAGRVGLGEYLYQNVGRSIKERCTTFFSWAKRHVVGAVGSIASGVTGHLGIEN